VFGVGRVAGGVYTPPLVMEPKSPLAVALVETTFHVIVGFVRPVVEAALVTFAVNVSVAPSRMVGALGDTVSEIGPSTFRLSVPEVFVPGSGLVTVTAIFVPAAALDVPVNCIVVLETIFTPVAGWPSNITCEEGIKPVPVRVIVYGTPELMLYGESDEMDGAGFSSVT
jgi:hypothetical protein